jgi:hypothetical protein
MLVLIVTSLVRTRISYRAWRVLHWTAYLCWLTAVVHGLGTGTDTPVRWVLLLTLACVAIIRASRLAAGLRMAAVNGTDRLPRLLPGTAAPLTLDEHLARYGPLPLRPAGDLIAEVSAAGLTGRGGAAFPA